LDARNKEIRRGTKTYKVIFSHKRKLVVLDKGAMTLSKVNQEFRSLYFFFSITKVLRIVLRV
jgi:hypothetical protein